MTGTFMPALTCGSSQRPSSAPATASTAAAMAIALTFTPHTRNAMANPRTDVVITVPTPRSSEFQSERT